jgi:hypothetical protein
MIGTTLSVRARVIFDRANAELPLAYFRLAPGGRSALTAFMGTRAPGDLGKMRKELTGVGLNPLVMGTFRAARAASLSTR